MLLDALQTRLVLIIIITCYYVRLGYVRLGWVRLGWVVIQNNILYCFLVGFLNNSILCKGQTDLSYNYLTNMNLTDLTDFFRHLYNDNIPIISKT
jgi:hypothetical protein